MFESTKCDYFLLYEWVPQLCMGIPRPSKDNDLWQDRVMMTRKRFPHCWTFERWIHRPSVVSLTRSNKLFTLNFPVIWDCMMLTAQDCCWALVYHIRNLFKFPKTSLYEGSMYIYIYIYIYIHVCVILLLILYVIVSVVRALHLSAIQLDTNTISHRLRWTLFSVFFLFLFF